MNVLRLVNGPSEVQQAVDCALRQNWPYGLEKDGENGREMKRIQGKINTFRSKGQLLPVETERDSVGCFCPVWGQGKGTPILSLQ